MVFFFLLQILGYLPGEGKPVNVTCEVKVQAIRTFEFVFHVWQPRLNVSLCLHQKGAAAALGEVQFFPKSIFDLKYYPYYGKLRHVSSATFQTVIRCSQQLVTVYSPPVHQGNYSAPVVAVRFASVQNGAQIQVQCKLNGKGIINDSSTDRYLGSVTFSLEVGG